MNEQVINFINQLDNLPVLPETTQKLMGMLQDPEVSIGEVAKVVKQCPVLAVRVLRLANSSAFEPVNPITGLDIAVTRIGLSGLRHIVMIDGAIKAFPAISEYDFSAYWKHSIAVSFLAPALLKHIHPVDEKPVPDDAECFTAGLLHNVGILILVAGFTHDMMKLMEIAEQHRISLNELEANALGITHPEVGARVCEKWNLPPAIVSAARHHHFPEQANDEHLHLVQIVHIADHIAENRGAGQTREVHDRPISAGAWHDLGLELDDVPAIIESADIAAADSGGMLL